VRQARNGTPTDRRAAIRGLRMRPSRRRRSGATRLRPGSARLVPIDAMAQGARAIAGIVEGIWYPGGTWRYDIRAGGSRFLLDDPGCFAVGEPVAIVFTAPEP